MTTITITYKDILSFVKEGNCLASTSVGVILDNMLSNILSPDTKWYVALSEEILNIPFYRMLVDVRLQKTVFKIIPSKCKSNECAMGRFRITSQVIAEYYRVMGISYDVPIIDVIKSMFCDSKTQSVEVSDIYHKPIDDVVTLSLVEIFDKKIEIPQQLIVAVKDM